MTCRPYWCVLGHVPMYSAIDTSEVCIFTILYGQGLQGLPDPLLLCMYIRTSSGGCMLCACSISLTGAHMQTHVRAHIGMYVHMLTNTHACTHICTHMHTYTHTHTHTHTHARTHSHTWPVHCTPYHYYGHIFML